MKRALGISAIAIIGIVAWLLFNQEGQSSARASGEPDAASSLAAKPHDLSLRHAPATTVSKDTSSTKRDPLKRITRERRLEIIKALAATRSASSAVDEDHEPGTMIKHELPDKASDVDVEPGETRLTNKEYLRERINELRPLIEECYSVAKQNYPSVPNNIPVAFTIGADPEIGGVVTEASVEGAAFETLGSLTECVRETLYTLELDPPAKGGELKVVYPFKFGEGPSGPN